MAFWTEYKVPSWWGCWNPQEPKILQTAEALIRPVPSISRMYPIRRCQPFDAAEIETLLRNHFTSWARCRTELPAERIRAGFQKGWIGVVARETSKNALVGCAFSLEATYQGQPCGIVDFFCVAPDWRKKGVGRCLLRSLVNETASQGRLIHFFMKEGFPLLSLPPVYQGRWMWRQTAALGEPTPGFHFQDLYHRSLPEGYRLGELVAYPETASKEEVEAAIDQSRFEIVLMDTQFPHDPQKGWKNDSTYQWYCFNFHPGSFFSPNPPGFYLK